MKNLNQYFMIALLFCSLPAIASKGQYAFELVINNKKNLAAKTDKQVSPQQQKKIQKQENQVLLIQPYSEQDTKVIGPVFRNAKRQDDYLPQLDSQAKTTKTIPTLVAKSTSPQLLTSNINHKFVCTNKCKYHKCNHNN